jgi:hypothetical protein
VQYIPQIVYDQKKRIDKINMTVIILTMLTIIAWALFTFMAETVGDMGIISLILMVRIG